MNKIGLTGGIACGKSTACKWFMNEMGWNVLDTDNVAHKLLESGSQVHAEVVAEFGDKILNEEGHVDRRILGEIVFGDTSKLKKLNAIIHPAVRERTNDWLSEQTQISIVAVPLLFENGLESDFDTIMCISASKDTQIARLAGRGFDRDAALKRIHAQMPVVKKSILSDYVVYNDKSLNLLNEQLVCISRDFQERINGR